MASLATTFADVVAATTTAPLLETFQSEVLWMVIAGFIIAFILAFAVGANDVANSFGTTVGSGTLSLKQACILASVFELLGAILLGAKVGTTIRKGIIDVTIYKDSEDLLMAGEVSAMLGSGLWQLAATFFKLPVSGTHSIVGATIGFSLVAFGQQGVQWMMLMKIVMSWFLSPVLSGIAAASFYYMLRRLIFLKENPLVPILIALPIMYGITIGINIFSVFYSGAALLGFDQLSLGVDIALAVSLAVLVAVLVRFTVVKKLKQTMLYNSKNEQAKSLMANGKEMMNKPQNAKPPTMETIPETSPLKVDSDSDSKPPAYSSLNKDIQKLNTKFNLSTIDEEAAPRTIEEAKRRRQSSKRTQSAGVYNASTARIPPLLRLEQKVMKSNVSSPTVREIKSEIRRNFSEPAIISLTEKSDADMYEVFINRQTKLVTIQRKRVLSLHNNTDDAAKAIENIRLKTKSETGSAGVVDDDINNLVGDTKLEDPFDSSDDEGLQIKTIPRYSPTVAPTTSAVHYSEAIEEGFRRLSTSQTNIIAIKIEEGEEEEVTGGKQSELHIADKIETKENQPEVRQVFGVLQILTACFGAFAHGGNDVSNAIGPLIALWLIFSEGEVKQESDTPILILFYGGLGIICGLWLWGRRVMKTMGQDITNLTPSRGFSIELMSAITVLACSNLALPVSTTHCKVGAVVFVGWVRGREAVDWKIFRNIVLAWFVTVPVSGVLTAVIFIIVKAAAGL